MVFCHHQLNYLLKRQVPRTEHASFSSRHRVKKGPVQHCYRLPAGLSFSRVNNAEADPSPELGALE